ncbi:MAG: condensation domain-containing protein [Thermodesulfovibrionales bacterium]
MQGRLNIFQMTMLKWDEFHPYNAIGLLKVPGRLDARRLKSALNRSIERRGIGRFRLDRKLRAYSYPGGSYTADLRVISGTEDALKAVHNEVELQLNMRFVEAGGEINPFRFFAVDGPDFFYLGIVYFHVIADGYSLAQLAKDIAHAYQSDNDEALMQCTDLYPDTYRSMFRRNPVSFFLPSLSIPNFLSGLRRSTKPYQMYHVNDQQLGFRLLRCDAPIAATLTAVAHTWGVTQNDVLLALVFKIIAPFVMEKKVRTKKGGWRSGRRSASAGNSA